VKKVGHAGTLDPFATGLLLVLVGRGTKLARFFVDLSKVYECTIQFGAASSTGDLTGELSLSGATTTREAIDDVLPQFLGRIMQKVPMTSAVKVDGERLYKKAHRGEVIETPVREVTIESITVRDFDETAQSLRCQIRCSKGTYVRQLATDIGDLVGTGGYLEQLARTAIGPFQLDAGQPLAEFENAVVARDEGDARIPGLATLAQALDFLPAVEVPAAQVPAIRNGSHLPSGPSEPVRITYRGELLAIYGPVEGERGIQPLVMM
jgi:tRNA pseudouridine55 synthase